MDRKRRPKLSRELIGAGLLLGLLIFGLGCSFAMPRSHARLARQLDDAGWAALSEDWNTALTLSADAREDWNRRWKAVAAVADHSPMEEIDTLFRQLSVYGALRTGEDFASICAALSARVAAMGDSHKLSWWNLL